LKARIDTNILVRFFAKADEDAEQIRIVTGLFEKADEIIIPTHVFCEFVWVLSTRYKIAKKEIQASIEALMDVDKVILNEDEIGAGLRMMHKGGDFADGVNDYIGRQMTRGASVFVSFDKKAVRLLTEQGIPALVPE
jgi:predicted nucleic-acid-binding protein